MQGHFPGGVLQSPTPYVPSEKDPLWHQHIPDADEPCTTGLRIRVTLFYAFAHASAIE